MKNNDMKSRNSTGIQDINEGFSEYLKEQNIKAFYQFDKFEFIAPSKDGLGLGETDIMIVEKEVEGKNGKKISIFEFYKDGQLIANTNKSGELVLSEDYKKFLKLRFKGFL